MDCKSSSSELVSQIINTCPNKTKTKTTKSLPRYRHILATPLVDVVSARIRTANLTRWPRRCAIYGYIQVINSRLGYDAKPLSLFHRDKNNPLLTRVGKPLPLKRSSCIFPSEYTLLDVCLFDKNANNMVFAKGQIVLNKKNDACEENCVTSVFGNNSQSFVLFHYSVFQYAVAATVDVLFFRKDDKFDLLTEETEEQEYKPCLEMKYDKIDVINYDRREREDGGVDADVFGSVSAYCNVTKEKRKSPISLFWKSPKKAVRVKSGDFIPLSRSLVIVPAYSSSLTVKVNLSSLGNNKPLLASGILEFHPEYKQTYKEDLDGEHGRVRVRVTWNHAYDQQLYHEKKQEYQYVKQRFPASDRVEVFSVAVHRKKTRDFSVYGRVDVEDINQFCMYSRDKSCPQVCPQAGPLLAPLKGPHSRSFRTSEYFWIRVHLKDGTTGGEVSDGQAAWDSRFISFFNERRLCSVISGELGFAAVHYTAFCDEYAESARVNVKLYGEKLPGYVYGKIVARYTTYEYSSAYEKKYYQNILFDRESEADGLKPAAVESGLDLPLLKSVVCLPVDSNLVIEFDLAVVSQPILDGSDYCQDATLLKGGVELTRDQCDQQLNGKTFHIDVSMTILSWEAHFDYLS
ncbi:uncharacterized protein LOC141643316 [Silene latifolia]|uniref:uncharacterized protein LOC141643316 n=1 Tax=Silene latifolia TaxID=37657 RepID=UPI003D783851